MLNKFKFSSIRAKILTGFGILITLVIILSIFNLNGLRIINNQTEEAISEGLPLLVVNEKMMLNISEITSLSRGYMLYGGSMTRNQIDAEIELGEILEEEMMELDPSESTAAILDRKDEWEAKVLEAVEASDADNQQEAMLLLDEARIIASDVTTTISQMAEEHEQRIGEQGE